MLSVSQSILRRILQWLLNNEKGMKTSVSGLILIYVVEFSLMDWLKPQESQLR
jgi:hypothetical protein